MGQSNVSRVCGAIMDVLLPWILLFALFVVLPAITRRRYAAAVEQEFNRIQKKRKSRIIAIVHRQEPMGLLGIAQLRYIDLNDAEDVLNAIRNTPKNTPIEFILHTPGGLVLPALQIARALKAHPAPTRVFVPHYAMSGGTLIAMGADEIMLNPHAVLGPIDPQIGGLPAASIAAVKDQKNPDAIDDYTLVLADVAEKAQRQLERAAEELLTGTVSPNAARAVAEQMSSGRWTHDYPIEAHEAKEIGLNVSLEMPAEINGLMALFPDKASRRSVTFTQTPMARIWPFGRKKEKPMAPPPAPPSDRTPFIGFAPGPGARSHSFGPWNPGELRRGPSEHDIRRDQ